MRQRVLMPLVVLVLVAVPTQASQTQVHAVEGSDLLAGELEGASIVGASIGGDVRIKSGPEQRLIVEGLAGAVLSVTRAGDGQLYVATAGPGKVLRVESGKTEEIYVADKPLVTAVLPVGKGTLVALLAPEGGAEIIELASKKHTRIAAPASAKLILAGAVVDDVVYAVGGGDDGGVLLKLTAPKRRSRPPRSRPPRLARSRVARSGGSMFRGRRSCCFKVARTGRTRSRLIQSVSACSLVRGPRAASLTSPLTVHVVPVCSRDAQAPTRSPPSSSTKPV